MKDRAPLLPAGDYPDLEIVDTKLLPGGAGKTETFQVTLKVAESSGEEAARPGTTGAMIFALGDKYQYGERRVVAVCMAGAGYADPDEYAGFDPEGQFIEACEGKTDNPFATEDGSSPLAGRHVAAVISRGNATPDGNDYYRNAEWIPLEDPIT